MPFSEYYSSFDPQLISLYVDFISIHIYPATISNNPYTDNSDMIKLTMSVAYTGKPIIVEDMYHLVPLDKHYKNFLKFERNSVN